jgi:25S rRNA (uracil2634-N3)-methyltransferase
MSRRRRDADDDDARDAKRFAATRDAVAPAVALHMTRAQLACARAGCVVCRRAVFATAGVANAPNARPEACARARDGGERRKRIGLYDARRARVLAVGDGDFTFSRAVARALGGAGVTATSHETRASLDAIYGERAMEETLGELERLGARVIHGVDAGNLRETLPETVERGTFDAAIWNFPCVARDADGSAREAALGGFDARSAEELEANRALVERFVAGASEYVVKNGGEIHVTHKVGMQCDWGIESAAATTAPGVVCAGAVVFDRMSYPGYRPMKALVAKSFPVTDARTFVFTNAEDGASITLAEKSKLVSRVNTQ